MVTPLFSAMIYLVEVYSPLHPQHLRFKILHLYCNYQNIFFKIFIYLYLNLINSIKVNYYFLMLWVTIDIEYLRIFFLKMNDYVNSLFLLNDGIVHQRTLIQKFKKSTLAKIIFSFYGPLCSLWHWCSRFFYNMLGFQLKRSLAFDCLATLAL